MGAAFIIDNKNITIPDDICTEYRQISGGPVTENLVKCKLELYYGDNIFTGEKGLTLEEAVAQHSENELSAVASELIARDIKSDSGYAAQDSVDKAIAGWQEQ